MCQSDEADVAVSGRPRQPVKPLDNPLPGKHRSQSDEAHAPITLETLKLGDAKRTCAALQAFATTRSLYGCTYTPEEAVRVLHGQLSFLLERLAR